MGRGTLAVSLCWAVSTPNHTLACLCLGGQKKKGINRNSPQQIWQNISHIWAKSRVRTCYLSCCLKISVKILDGKQQPFHTFTWASCSRDTDISTQAITFSSSNHLEANLIFQMEGPLWTSW